MPRLILLVSLLPLVICLAAHAWFSKRIIAAYAARICRCHLDRWEPPIDRTTTADPPVPPLRRAEATALEFAAQLYSLAMRDWAEEDAKAFRTRDHTRRMTAVTPPFCLLVVIFGLLTGKILWFAALAVVIASVSLMAAYSMLTLPIELAALARTARRVRETGAFPNTDEEFAIIHCAQAIAWDNALPPLLKSLRRNRGVSPI